MNGNCAVDDFERVVPHAGANKCEAIFAKGLKKSLAGEDSIYRLIKFRQWQEATIIYGRC
ncbi:hypothetical protein BN2475_580023 [Paraburkholderia ribeironis]|uniref:Uncharacterized protein n=1 Tax=Paraburkholderia ribeironis TaxID=1247936 RepID=A0A1N7SFA5_9BURK|nr:hypothetical protein BN2475_580023 [Paraburkholderia ribeironis]